MKKKSTHNTSERKNRLFVFILLCALGFFMGSFVSQRNVSNTSSQDIENATDLVMDMRDQELATLENIQDKLSFGTTFTNTTLPGFQIPILNETLDFADDSGDVSGSLGITKADSDGVFSRVSVEGEISTQELAPFHIDESLGLVYLNTVFDAVVIGSLVDFDIRSVEREGATVLASKNIVVMQRNEQGALVAVDVDVAVSPGRVIRQGDKFIFIDGEGVLY
ncbi:MAG: hypothetical protein ACI83D_000249 [Planctomycetota bacterium]|jgi:hypothetical protein